MANAYNYSNTAVPTTLAGNISAGATTVSVLSTVGFPTVPYIIAIDYGASTEELVKVTSVAGLALTVERGFGSTSAQTHSLGAVVRPVYNAVDATDFRTHEDSTAAHGATGAVVGTTTTQTLTNKTLTSPTLNTPTVNSMTFNGTVTGGVDIVGDDPNEQTFTVTAAGGQSIEIVDVKRAGVSVFTVNQLGNTAIGGDLSWTADPGWTTYTPTWTASVNPVLGNGTITGRYRKFGRTVHLQIDLTMGSTTTYGTGAWTLSLPVAAGASTGSRIGVAQALGGSRFPGQVVVSPGASGTSPFFPASSSVSNLSSATSAVPFAWATGNELRITVTYEAAS